MKFLIVGKTDCMIFPLLLKTESLVGVDSPLIANLLKFMELRMHPNSHMVQ